MKGQTGRRYMLNTLNTKYINTLNTKYIHTLNTKYDISHSVVKTEDGYKNE